MMQEERLTFELKDAEFGSGSSVRGGQGQLDASSSEQQKARDVVKEVM